jgi:DNA-binding CsgD family transcriptional regulator
MTIRPYAECAGCQHREIAPSFDQHPSTWTYVAEPGKEHLWYCSRGCELRHLAAEQSQSYNPYGLTDIEIRMLEEVARGFSNKEVAARIGRSETAMKNALSLVYAKLNARDRVQAMLMAHAIGVINLSALSREFYQLKHIRGLKATSLP